MSKLSPGCFLLCGCQESTDRFNKATELLRQSGHSVVHSACPVSSVVNVTSIRIDLEEPKAEIICRALAVASGACLIDK